MKITIKGTYVDLTPAIKEYLNEKIGGLARYAEKLSAKVELERDQHHRSGEVFRAEVTIIADGKSIRAEAISPDMYASIDLVVPKLKEQITKFKKKRTVLERKGARLAKKILDHDARERRG
jgi:putative sigma-54 modulation protein